MAFTLNITRVLHESLTVAPQKPFASKIYPLAKDACKSHFHIKYCVLTEASSYRSNFERNLLHTLEQICFGLSLQNFWKKSSRI